MDNTKKIIFLTSLVCVAIGLAASVWLYTVLHDITSIAMMAFFFLATIWFGYNVRNIFKSKP
jgi:hypothetical protein